jgi:TRAP-type C4-dicarboxylate transport system substrate-binding protein
VVEAEKVARLTYDGFGKLLDTMSLKELEKKGMKIHRLTPEQKRMFIEKARPYVRRWMEEKHGKEYVEEFFSAIRAAEEQLKNQAESTKTSRQ